MSTSYTPAEAGVVLHATKFCPKSFSQEKRPFSILDELYPEHSVGSEGVGAAGSLGFRVCSDAPPRSPPPDPLLSLPVLEADWFQPSPSPGLAVKSVTWTKVPFLCQRQLTFNDWPCGSIEVWPPMPQFRATLQSQPSLRAPWGRS